MSYVHRDKAGQSDAAQALAKILSVPGLPNAHWSIGAGTGNRLDGRLHDGHADTELRQHIQDYADAFDFTVRSQPDVGLRGPFTRLRADGEIAGTAVTVWVPIYPLRPKTIVSRAAVSVQRTSTTQVCVDTAPLRDLISNVIMKVAAPEMRQDIDLLTAAIEACDLLSLTREQEVQYDDLIAEHDDALCRRRDVLDAILAEVPDTLYMGTLTAETLGTLLLEAVREQAPVRNVAGAATSAGGPIPAQRTAVAGSGPVDWSRGRGAA